MTTLSDAIRQKQAEREAKIARDREKHLAEAAQRKLREEGTSIVDIFRRKISGGGSSEGKA